MWLKRSIALAKQFGGVFETSKSTLELSRIGQAVDPSELAKAREFQNQYEQEIQQLTIQSMLAN